MHLAVDINRFPDRHKIIIGVYNLYGNGRRLIIVAEKRNTNRKNVPIYTINHNTPTLSNSYDINIHEVDTMLNAPFIVSVCMVLSLTLIVLYGNAAREFLENVPIYIIPVFLLLQ